MLLETTTKSGVQVFIHDYANDEPEALKELLNALDRVIKLESAKIYCSPKKNFEFSNGSSDSYLEWKFFGKSNGGYEIEKLIRFSSETGKLAFFSGVLREDESRKNDRLIFETEF